MSNQSRVETVYDKCMYTNCCNGRYSTGTHLFRFPTITDTRCQLWIRNSGKFFVLYIFEISSIGKFGRRFSKIKTGQ